MERKTANKKKSKCIEKVTVIKKMEGKLRKGPFTCKKKEKKCKSKDFSPFHVDKFKFDSLLHYLSFLESIVFSKCLVES